MCIKLSASAFCRIGDGFESQPVVTKDIKIVLTADMSDRQQQ